MTTRADLAQNTTNAALAYNTLQKSNNLATRFIDTADAFLEKNAGDDRLKFIRDQWVEYQMVTASLEQDEKAADEMAQKGHLLSAEKSATALASLGENVSGVIASVSSLNYLICSNVRDNLGASARENLGASVRENLGASARENLGASARENLGASVRENLGVAARENLGVAVDGVLGAAARENLGMNTQRALGAAAGAVIQSAVQGDVVGNVESLRFF